MTRQVDWILDELVKRIPTTVIYDVSMIFSSLIGLRLTGGGMNENHGGPPLQQLFWPGWYLELQVGVLAAGDLVEVDVGVAALHGGGALEGCVQAARLLPVGRVGGHVVQVQAWKSKKNKLK